MSAIAVAKANESGVLMKAFGNACRALLVSNVQAGQIIGVNPSTLSRNSNKGFSPQSKTGELQLQFIRLYRSLFAIAGGDLQFMQHWYQTSNSALGGIPAQMCQTITGLVSANQYLDAMRGKV
jgi:hypothetical protein